MNTVPVLVLRTGRRFADGQAETHMKVFRVFALSTARVIKEMQHSIKKSEYRAIFGSVQTSNRAQPRILPMRNESSNPTSRYVALRLVRRFGSAPHQAKGDTHDKIIGYTSRLIMPKWLRGPLPNLSKVWVRPLRGNPLGSIMKQKDRNLPNSGMVREQKLHSAIGISTLVPSALKWRFLRNCSMHGFALTAFLTHVGTRSLRKAGSLQLGIQFSENSNLSSNLQELLSYLASAATFSIAAISGFTFSSLTRWSLSSLSLSFAKQKVLSLLCSWISLSSAPVLVCCSS
jgi:hypothetical protein